MKHRSIAPGIALIAALVVGVGFSAPAQAATAVPAAAAASITCTINVQNPHGSTHVSGTVNVVSTVSCTAPVASITQQTALYKTTGNSWWGTKVTKAATSSAQSNASASCTVAPGNFYGTAVTSIVWPPGFSGPQPPSAYGNTTAVNCSTAQIVANSEGIISTETVTATLTK
ncbi:hypothetical protein [Gryllotalpicola protaetiae]|uniref:hypothetical protein n=1 Tax=Gryllotalpicola protaetiae TaxID=2419771 RepID=UPI0013C4BF93|nr:hypothetical protein [Gryllotalpicola protaetiae]